MLKGSLVLRDSTRERTHLKGCFSGLGYSLVGRALHAQGSRFNPQTPPPRPPWKKKKERKKGVFSPVVEFRPVEKRWLRLTGWPGCLG